jgi:sulfoxide reductase catalytic subunit YedY
MPTRRQFIHGLLHLFALTGLGLAAVTSRTSLALAALKRKVLGKNTDLNQLVDENPALLDARKLPVTPREKFETMGLSDHDVTLTSWRLSVTGAVKTPLNLTYKELRQLPVIERGVLLICPGFFAYKGRWRGISIRGLLEAAQTTESEVTHLTLSGPTGSYEKVERFSISELENDKLFLAYAVNDDNLPREHGFPLRLVAEDHYGSRWVKYVEKIEFQATN